MVWLQRHFFLLKIKHMLKHVLKGLYIEYIIWGCIFEWAVSKWLSYCQRAQHLASPLSKYNHKEKKQTKQKPPPFLNKPFHCWLVPNLHRNTEAQSSLHSFKPLVLTVMQCRGQWATPAHSSSFQFPSGMLRLQPAPLLATEKIEFVAISPVSREQWVC